MYNVPIEELPGKLLFLSTIVYCRKEDWGDFTNAMADVHTTHEKAEQWMENLSQGCAVVWSDIRPIEISCSAETIIERLVSGLRVERMKMQEEMSKTLTAYDDRINSLLAITYQPEPAPSTLVTEINRKKEYVLAVCDALIKAGDVRDLIYYDGEGDPASCKTLEDLSVYLWSCDAEAVTFTYIDGGLTIQLAWDNQPEDIIYDYAYSDPTMSERYEACEKETRILLGYTDDDIQF